MTLKDLISTLKDLFRDKVPITRRCIEILNYRYDKSVPITEHLDRINCHAADFDRFTLSDDNLRILLLLQLFCFSSDNDELKRIVLQVIEKNQDASLRDVVAELEPHKHLVRIKTLENLTKQSQIIVSNYLKSSFSLKSSFKTMSKQKSMSKVTNVSKLAATNTKCNRCGGVHPRAKCIFRDARCHKCSRKGHITRVFRSNSERLEPAAEIKSVVTHRSSQSINADDTT